MKLCFISEAIGYGHVMRDIEIFKRLKKSGWSGEFITYGDSAEYLRKNKYPVHYAPTSVDLKESPEGLDLSKTFIENIRAKHLRSVKKISDILNRSKPDLIVIDSSILGMIATDLHMGFRNMPVVYITSGNDLGTFGGRMLKTGIGVITKYVSKSSDLMLVPDIPLPYTLSEYNLEFFDNMKFIGPVSRFYGKKSAKKPEGVFVTTGKSGFTAQNFMKFIDGTGEKILKPTENTYDWLMLKSEVVIHHGGHGTAMEAALLGKPQIVIPQAGYAERIENGRKLEELGIAVLLDDKWVDEHVLKYAIEKAREKKKECARFSKLLTKYGGTGNACKEIKKLL